MVGYTDPLVGGMMGHHKEEGMGLLHSVDCLEVILEGMMLLHLYPVS